MNTVCTRCGTRGHLALQCFSGVGVAGGEVAAGKYELLPEETENPGRGAPSSTTTRPTSGLVPATGLQGGGVGTVRGAGRGIAATLPAWMTQGGHAAGAAAAVPAISADNSGGTRVDSASLPALPRTRPSRFGPAANASASMLNSSVGREAADGTEVRSSLPGDDRDHAVATLSDTPGTGAVARRGRKRERKEDARSSSASNDSTTSSGSGSGSRHADRKRRHGHRRAHRSSKTRKHRRRSSRGRSASRSRSRSRSRSSGAVSRGTKPTHASARNRSRSRSHEKRAHRRSRQRRDERKRRHTHGHGHRRRHHHDHSDHDRRRRSSRESRTDRRQEDTSASDAEHGAPARNSPTRDDLTRDDLRGSEDRDSHRMRKRGRVRDRSADRGERVLHSGHSSHSGSDGVSSTSSH